MSAIRVRVGSAWAALTVLLACLPAVVAAAETFHSPEPGSVTLRGLLGERYRANIDHWLLALPEEDLLAGFAPKHPQPGWTGERVGKWLDAAGRAWADTRDPRLRGRMERVVEALLAAQEADGYLGHARPEERWTGWDLWVNLYALSGLLSCHETTGDPRAREAALRLGELLLRAFGAGGSRLHAAGPHHGLAATWIVEPFVRLYETTGERRYLEAAQSVVAHWDQPDGPCITAVLGRGAGIANLPNTKAYELLLNLLGLERLQRATGDRALADLVVAAWRDAADRHLYLTGSASVREHFPRPYEWPADAGSHICETCVTVTWLELCDRLLRRTGEPEYADAIERTVFNHLLAAQHPSGGAWCYYTPLEGRKTFDREIHCCSMNGPRAVSLLPRLAWMRAADGFVLNLYSSGRFEAQVPDSRATVRIEQETGFPWDETIRLQVAASRPARFTIHLRIPAWCAGAQVLVNGVPRTERIRPGRYLVLTRTWAQGDVVDLRLPMPVRVLEGVYSNTGLRALLRGPCVLAVDGALSPDSGRLAPRWLRLGTESVAPALERGAGEEPVIRVDGLTHAPPAPEGGRPVRLGLRSFLSAGADGEDFRVWLLGPDAPHQRLVSLFAYGEESYSRKGNVVGSIADDATETYRVTYSNAPAEEDWFAVEVERPVQVDRIVYAHGAAFYDGGWFDASRGKPRVQVRRTHEAEWEDVAVLEAYPPTSATDARDLRPGQTFEARIAPLTVVGLRVVGRPAGGAIPSQAFASCAELQGFADGR